MKVKTGRFILVFVSFNLLFLSLYGFTSHLSARIFSPNEEESFIWNGQITKNSVTRFSGAEPVAVEPIIAEPVAVEPIIAEPVAVEPIIAEPVAVEAVIADSMAVEPIIAEPVAVEPVIAEPVAVKPTNSLIGNNFAGHWLDLWLESETVLSLDYVIHNPFDRQYKPNIYVQRTSTGFLICLPYSAVRNLSGDFLSQDHLELWLQVDDVKPPKNYGQISYQFGIGLDKKPWIKEFLGTMPSLSLQVNRREIEGFIELEISGLSDKQCTWNLVFSGAFFQQEWVQGYLLSAVQDFRWGDATSLLK